jgi:hypothetical protein
MGMYLNTLVSHCGHFPSNLGRPRLSFFSLQSSAQTFDLHFTQ